MIRFRIELFIQGSSLSCLGFAESNEELTGVQVVTLYEADIIDLSQSYTAKICSNATLWREKNVTWDANFSIERLELNHPEKPPVIHSHLSLADAGWPDCT